MEVLNAPLRVDSASLGAHPGRIGCLASRGQLLVAWNFYDQVTDRGSGEQYHLAFYHPDRGWRACRLHKEDFYLYGVLPSSDDEVYIAGEYGELIHISVGEEMRATLLAKLEKRFTLLYADREYLWTEEEKGRMPYSPWSNQLSDYDDIQVGKRETFQIRQLRLDKNGLEVVQEKILHNRVLSMKPLPDGTLMLKEDYRGFVVRTPSFEEMVGLGYEDAFPHDCSLFSRRVDKRFYYTENLNRGWNEMPIEVEDKDHVVSFFRQNDVYYAAVYRYGQSITELYRFSDKDATSSKRMWAVSGYYDELQFALYNNLVCIVDPAPITVSYHANAPAPKNQGFLVWDPQANTFQADIQPSSIAHASYVFNHNLKIPMVWMNSNNSNNKQYAKDVQ